MDQWIADWRSRGLRRDEHPAWFYAQMLVAPSWAVDWYQMHLKQDVVDLPNVTYEAQFGTRFEPSYGHMNEQGILYTSLAGLLNLLAMIDVLYRDPNRGRHPEVDLPTSPSPPPALYTQLMTGASSPSLQQPNMTQPTHDPHDSS